jgi:trafficking protein particle complex subunit 11
VTPLWITKHQARLPSAFVAFFSLTSDANTSSLQDNKLKSEIANIRNVLSSTNYRTKLVVVLVGEHTIAPPEVEERLAVIRRSAALDAKSVYFLPSASSLVEIVEFVRQILSSLQPICVEYYRDLSKHARRKRSRSTVPQPTLAPTAGTSQILTSQGWNVRYEFKLGVFAEFRQEMDAACRNYETAYESLFAPEVFESIAASSPRFNEARMLSDIIAIRIIRCQLWTGQSTGAVRSWVNHRDRIQDLLDRRGTGTEDYGWEAWQSTWSKTMAEIISRVEFNTMVKLDPEKAVTPSIYAQPEKALLLGERVRPWEQLHHQGYWLRMAQDRTRNRRLLAMKIPQEDRTPPGQPPASAIAKKAQLHDSYLALEHHNEVPAAGIPGYDYTHDITSTLQKAIEHYSNTRQLRTAKHLLLIKAVEYIISDAWQDAMRILKPLWNNSSWRHDGWWKLLQEIGWPLLECAKKTQDLEMILQLEWELSNRVFTPRQTHNYNLHGVLQPFDHAELKPTVAMVGEEVASSVVPAFVFASKEGNVGESLECQLSLRSCLQREAAPVRLSEVKIVFEGSLRPVHLVMPESLADESVSPSAQIVDVELHESSKIASRTSKRASAGAIASLTGFADLSIKPDEIKIFRLMVIPKEAGDAKVDSITMIVDDERFSLTMVTSRLDERAGPWWETRAGHPVPRPFAMERDATSVRILPRPPKMAISIPHQKDVYYTNEDIELQIELDNKESETAITAVDVRIISPIQHAVSIKWLDLDEQSPVDGDQLSDGSTILPQRSTGSLAPLATQTLKLLVFNTIDALDHEVEVTVRYSLASDLDTTLLKTVVIELPIVRPFEANYDFLARLDRKPWPNFFQSPEEQEPSIPMGLNQQFMVVASVYSFATEQLVIDSAALRVEESFGDVVCRTSDGRQLQQVVPGPNAGDTANPGLINPDETQKLSFDMTLQKFLLADRDTAAADLALDIKWRRKDSQGINTSTLAIPRFIAPMAEPRILLTTSSLSKDYPVEGLCQLRFTIENPSMHFLTFNVTMESSEDFAFSGPKACMVSLVPISRHAMDYRILSSKRGEWIKVNLGVVDAYFGKTLKIQPAGDGVRADKKGNVLVWVD